MIVDLALAAVVLTIPAAVIVWLSGSAWILVSICVPREWRARYRKFARDVLGRPRGKQHSAKIPRRLRNAVLRADRRTCCFCRSKDRPEIDHGHPWSAGYLTWLPNLFVLCHACNAAKGYKKGTAYELMEDHQGRNPARWIRALWGLAA
ncbi:MAG TPA: hypothetical protein VEV45_20870 [Streptosporangiaceae bacterium]|nr:hypothetical protein [Streptosporangiaceae bacterium]